MYKYLAVTFFTATLATLIVAALGTPTPSHAQAAPAPAAVQAGQAIFTQRCFACHSVIEDQVRLGPSLYHELKGPKPKKTPTEVRTILHEGKNKMPSFKDILTPADTDNILAYLKSL